MNASTSAITLAQRRQAVRLPLPILGLVLMVTGSALACSLSDFSGQPTAPAQVAEPTLTATPKRLFQDDFSDPSSGWNSLGDADGATEYANGRYRIWVNKPNWYLWSTPGLNFSDVRVEVEAINAAGIEASDFGVICRYQHDGNFYKFTVSSDGYYGISKVINGNEQLLGMPELQFSDSVIQPGSGAPNHLRADCVGDILALWANGQMLAAVKDTDLRSGDIGLIAGSYDTPGVDILFDNLVVTQP